MSMAFPTDNSDHLPRLNPAEIEQYLARGIFHGIGKNTAALLAAYFGSDTLEVLEFSPQRLKLIPGLYPYRIDAILSAWEKSKHNPVRGTQAWLLGMGISLGFAAVAQIPRFTDNLLRGFHLKIYGSIIVYRGSRRRQGSVDRHLEAMGKRRKDSVGANTRRASALRYRYTY